MAGRVAEAQLGPFPLTVAIYDYAALPPPVVERAWHRHERLCRALGIQPLAATGR